MTSLGFAVGGGVQALAAHPPTRGAVCRNAGGDAKPKRASGTVYFLGRAVAGAGGQPADRWASTHVARISRGSFLCASMIQELT